MTGENLPHIKVERLPQEGDVDLVPIFRLIGKRFIDSRDPEENAKANILLDNGGVSVNFTRAVLQRMSYAELSHEADGLQTYIAEAALILGADEQITKASLSPSLYGPLPEQE